jgi:hypothetical protein
MNLLFLIFYLLTPNTPIEAGKIKSTAEYYYFLDGETRKLSKTVYSSFNKKCFILEKEEKDPSGKLIRKEMYDYDVHDSLSEKRIFGPDGKIIYRSKIVYDPKGRQKECFNFINEDKLTSKTLTLYDPSRKVIRYDTYTSDGNLYNAHLFEYKEDFQKERITYPDGSIEWQAESFFDKNGNLIQKNEYPSCCLSIKYDFTYDLKGNILSQKSVKADGSKGITYSYSFQKEDCKKNWLAKFISEDGKPTTLIERKIEYY